LRSDDIPDNQRLVVLAGGILADQFDFAAVVVDARINLAIGACHAGGA
jgi:hypothetical protein